MATCILIVDDDSTLRHTVPRAIESQDGMELVGEAADGLQAVELARQLTPDIVLMDIRMPEMDGVEATAIIAKEVPSTRVIAMSSDTSHETVSAMSDAGAMGYVAKGTASFMAEIPTAMRAVLADRV